MGGRAWCHKVVVGGRCSGHLEGESDRTAIKQVSEARVPGSGMQDEREVKRGVGWTVFI